MKLVFVAHSGDCSVALHVHLCISWCKAHFVGVPFKFVATVQKNSLAALVGIHWIVNPVHCYPSVDVGVMLLAELAFWDRPNILLSGLWNVDG